MKFGNRKSISPVVATILLVALTVAAGATVYFLVTNVFNEEKTITITSTPNGFDHNNDGLVDALRLSVKNTGDGFEIKYIAFADETGVKVWYLAPDENTTFNAGEERLMTLFTNSSTDQLSPNSNSVLFMGSSSTDYGQGEIEVGSPTVPEPVNVTVTASGNPVVGVQISFTTPSGVPASVPPQLTDGTGSAQFYLLPNYYLAKTSDGQTSEVFHSLLVKSVSISGTSQQISVRVLDTDGTPLSGTSVYTADTSQNDLGGSALTNSSGYADFILTSGSYLFRVTYLSQNYWSSQVDVPSDVNVVTIQINSGTLNGSIYFGKVKIEKRMYLRLYTATNASMNYGLWTNSSGYFSFTRGVVAGAYRLRLYFNGMYYWSGVLSTSTPDLKADFGGGYLRINITVGGEPIRYRVLSRLYTAANRSVYLYSYTNSTGGVDFGAVPGGSYRIRLDWLRRYTFSPAFTHTGDAFTLDFEGGRLVAQIRLNDTVIRERVLIRLFTDNDLYTYYYAWTNATGYVDFGVILAGNYKFRIDWLRQYKFTPEFYHDGLGPKTVDIEGYKMVIQIKVGGEPIRGRVLTRLFTGNDLYTYYYAYTNDSGYVSYGGILAGTYKLRIDWMRQYTLSSPFNHTSSNVTTVQMNGGRLLVQVNIDGQPIRERVLTRLFNGNLYTYYYAYTNATGWVDYGTILNGTYKLRIDWLRQYVFSGEFDHQNSTTKNVVLPGGRLLVHITTDGENLPNRVLTRLFLNSSNAYTYYYAYTNATGWVDYGIILNATYKLRIDWLRQYQFTDPFVHADSLPKTLDMDGGNLTVQVKVGGEPLTRRTLIRLFTNSLQYTYRYAYTNSSGYVNFGPVLAANYTLRIDALRQYVYTTYFVHNNSQVQSASHAGTANLYVRILDGANSNAPVGKNQLIRLFLDSGNTYTYLYAYTNDSGIALFQFVLNNTYKVRWDNPNPDIYSAPFAVNDTATATIDLVLSPSTGLQGAVSPFAGTATTDAQRWNPSRKR